MTIRNLEAFMAGLWDWAILDGCFGETRIMPSDTDGEVERNGHFLVLEAKSPGVLISQGQRIKFQHRAQRGDTVMVIWGKQNKPENIMIWRPYCRFGPDSFACDISKFRDLVSSWFDWADKNGA